jgi:hypothetical protein
MLTAKADPNSVKALRSALDDLPIRLGDRAILTGLKRAMGSTVKEARRIAPRRTGSLARAVHVVKGKLARPGSPYVVLRINPKSQTLDASGRRITPKRFKEGYSGDTQTVKPNTYLHWTIIGTGGGTRTSKRRGFVLYNDQGQPFRIKKIQHPGTRGRNWLRDTWKNTQADAVRDMLPQIRKRVDEVKSKHGIR